MYARVARRLRLLAYHEHERYRKYLSYFRMNIFVPTLASQRLNLTLITSKAIEREIDMLLRDGSHKRKVRTANPRNHKIVMEEEGASSGREAEGGVGAAYEELPGEGDGGDGVADEEQGEVSTSAPVSSV